MDDTGHGLVHEGGAGYTMTWLGSERWGRVHHDRAWFRKVGQGTP